MRPPGSAAGPTSPTVDAPIALATALAAPELPRRRLMAVGGGGGAPPLRVAPAAPRAPTALLVGPEGGFTPAEMDAARDAGFDTVTLGPRILRVETAAMVAVALVAGISSSLADARPRSSPT